MRPTGRQGRAWTVGSWALVLAGCLGLGTAVPTAAQPAAPAGNPPPVAIGPDDPAAVAAMIRRLELREAPVALGDNPAWTKPRRIAVRAGSPERLAWFQDVAPGVELVNVRTDQEAVAAAGEVDAIVGFCNPEVLAAGSRIRWIQLYSAGAGPCVDIPGVRARNILVTNMQRVSSPEIAEHVLAMLLALNRGLHRFIPLQQEGKWAPDTVPQEQMWELEGRTLLVVGLGGIGTEVARRAHALGMRVVATRASVAPRPEFVAYVGQPGELLQLAATADVVVNAVPLVPATERLFDARFFNATRRGAIFINVGRGRSVVQEDLVAALKDGRLSGAGLDVTEPEPLPPDHPLWQLPNVIITPHVAASSDRILGRVLLVARENLRRYVAGEKMLSVVDNQRGY